MALTTAETERIEAIETMLNNLQTAISNLASKQQIRQLILIKQQEIDELTARVASLESQVVILQSSLT